MAQPPSPSRFAPAELADAFAEAADYDRLSYDPSGAFTALRSAAAVPAPTPLPVAAASPPRSPVAPAAATPAPAPASPSAASSPRASLLAGSVLLSRPRRASSEGGTQPAAPPAAPPPQSPPAAEALDAFEARVMALEAEAAARHEADLAAAEAEAAAAERAAATDMLAPHFRPPPSPEPLAMLHDMELSASWPEVRQPRGAAPQPPPPEPRVAPLPGKASAPPPPDAVLAHQSPPKAANKRTSAVAPASPPAARTLPRAAMPASAPEEQEAPPPRPPAVTSLCAVRSNAFGNSGALGSVLMRFTSAFSCSGGPPEDVNDDSKR